MRPVRKFWLRNAVGEQIDLNGAEGIWATDPTGLGVQLNPSWGNLTSGFFTVLEDQYEPQQPVGLTLKLTRRGRVYDDYHALAGWLAAAGDGLLLLYQPPGGSVYWRSVSLQYLKKGETDRLGWLSCPLSLLPRTPWYLPSEAGADVAEQSADVMRYGWRCGEARYAASHAASYAAVLQPGGDMPGVIRIRFAGTAVSPVITLTGLATGTLYGRLIIDAELQTGDVLEYSSAVQDSYVRILRGGSVIELDNALDPTEEPFFRLPLSEPCTLQISGASIDGSARVSVSYLYRTV